jgi:hypothetical protein
MEMAFDRRREQLRGVWVSRNFYTLLGVRPLLGRTLSPSDDRAGHLDPVSALRAE